MNREKWRGTFCTKMWEKGFEPKGAFIFTFNGAAVTGGDAPRLWKW